MVWLDGDEPVVSAVRLIGLRAMARATGCSAPTIGRWLESRGGLSVVMYTLVRDEILRHRWADVPDAKEIE